MRIDLKRCLILGACATVLATADRASASYKHNVVTLWEHGVVPVCFSTSLNHEGGDFKRIRDAVQNTWGRAANITFTGWGKCPAKTSAQMPDGPPVVFVTMTFADAVFLPGKCSSFAGCALPGVQPHRRPTPVYIPPNVLLCNTGEPGGFTREECVAWTAVHEFGHVLGLAEEVDRGDFPGCKPWDIGWPHNRGGGTELTPYDRSSTMNYCSDGAGTNKGRLTHRDVAGIQMMYGMKPDGTFVATGGRCMDMDNVDVKPGSIVQLWECLGGLNQRWNYGAVTGALWSNHAPYMCLDDASGGTALGTQVDVFPCASRANQRWDLQRIYIKTPGQKCIFVDKNSNLIQTTCDTTRSMHYTYTPQGQFKRTIADLCLEFAGGVGSQGRQVPCNASHPGQIIEPGPDGQLVTRYMCLEVDEPDPEVRTITVDDNRKITLQPCAAKLTQRFKLAGYLKSSGGLCVTAASNEQSRNGTRLVLGDCAKPFVFDFQPNDVYLVPYP